MPRLLQSSRRAQHPRGITSAPQTKAELPPYEAPACPMDDAGKRALTEISNNRDTRKYEQHLLKSISLLRESVGQTNDRLHYRKDIAKQMAAKRAERGEGGKDHLEASAVEGAEKLSREVPSLTSRAETAVREIIDYRAELQEENTVLDEVHAEVERQQPRRNKLRKQRGSPRPSDGHDDDMADDGAEALLPAEDAEMNDLEDETPHVGASELLGSIRQSRTESYNNLSMYERYGLNNDYISFKRTLHDALYQDESPLPDASTWFGPDGSPVLFSKDSNGADNRNDGEDDLVIEREVLSFKCPLTLQTMSEPYTSRVCNHTFEKASILEFIRSTHGVCNCPVCPAEIKTKDLFLDEVMQRKIQRAQRTAHHNMDDDADVEPDADADESISFERSANIKREGVRGQQVADGAADD